MKSYFQLLESATNPNNTHITHFEDVVFYRGYKGVRSALDLANRISKEPDSINISEKFDGAPSVFFGPAPQSGKFFIATKSIFNKKPKIYFTPQEIQDNVKSKDLAKKLTYALHFLQELKPTQILQGDILYIKGDVKTTQLKGNGYIVFHPNTLMYGVESDTSLSHDIIRSKIGIVLHTKWSGNDLTKLTPEYNITKSDYDESTTNVFVHDPTINGRELDSINLDSSIKKALKLSNRLKPLLNKISSIKGLGQLLEQHHNTLVRRSSTNIGGIVYIQSLIKFLKEKNKKYVSNINESFKDVIELHKLMEQIKVKIYKNLNKREVDIKAFIKEKGSIVYDSDIEGFIINKTGHYPLKFVDRPKFSRYNFDDKLISKGWSKND